MSWRLGEALGGLDWVSWYWVFCVVVVSWVDICDVVDSWSSDWVSSSWIMMVPPPWLINLVMRS